MMIPSSEPSRVETGNEDFFENKVAENDLHASPTDTLPDDFDQLPIELVSLTDRFIVSLTSAKIYTSPPSIDKLSELFQDFYLQAESHISTHIQALSSRQFRNGSPAPSVSSKTSASSKSLSRLKSKTSKDLLDRPERVDGGQQMLTPSEVLERRRNRRLLEHKRLALEEAVERRVCEGIYERIWRHKSSLDFVRDEKLRSRTAALALVEVGLKDLGIDFSSSDDTEDLTAERANRIEEWISKAREGLLKMNESRHPLGKLQSLASTHQNIVELLSNLHQSSSSADEILPTLIYTLITCPPEGINVVSNMNFIQRFRSANKINGEAAYCLTNLEAAITFLENVDLATLRSDEAIDGTSKSSSRAPTPSAENGDSWASKGGAVSPATTPLTAVPPRLSSSASSKAASSNDTRPPTPRSPSSQRRLSALFQPPASAFGAASDVVRNTADQSLKNISTTLDSSFKLLFGRLKEQHVQSTSGDAQGPIAVPKTLDDARKLVSPKPALDEEGNISETSSFTEQEEQNNPREDRLLDLITGTGKNRERSADSALSSNSGNKRLARSSTQPISPSPPTSVPATAVDSMRSLGNTLNPLNRFAGMNVMRGFGRNPAPSPVAISATPQAQVDTSKENAESKDITDEGKLEPPIARFLEVESVGELKVAELETLLKDYRRFASWLQDRDLC